MKAAGRPRHGFTRSCRSPPTSRIMVDTTVAVVEIISVFCGGVVEFLI